MRKSTTSTNSSASSLKVTLNFKLLLLRETLRGKRLELFFLVKCNSKRIKTLVNKNIYENYFHFYINANRILQ